MALTKKKKIIIGASALLVLIVIVIVSVFASRKEEPEVTTIKIDVRPELRQTVTASGEVRPIRYIKLTSEVQGRIQEIYVNAGDQVKVGTPLVRIDPTQLQSNQEAQWAATQASVNDVQNARNAVTSAEQGLAVTEAGVAAARQQVISQQTAVDRAQVDLNTAQRELKRVTDLIEAGVASRLEYDNARDRFDQAKIALDTAKANLESQRLAVKEAVERANQQRSAVQEAKTSIKSSEMRANQQQAVLRGQSSQRSKAMQTSPLNGVDRGHPDARWRICGSWAFNDVADDDRRHVYDQCGSECRRDGDFQCGSRPAGKSQSRRAGRQRDQGRRDAEEPAGCSQVRYDRWSFEPGERAGSKGIQGDDRVTRVTRRDQEWFAPGHEFDGHHHHENQEQRTRGTARGHRRKAAERFAFAVSHNRRQCAHAGRGEKPKTIKGVYILNANKVKFVEVTTGITGEADIEITSGVQAGMEVVRGPSRVLKTLKDGMTIKRQTTQTRRQRQCKRGQLMSDVTLASPPTEEVRGLAANGNGRPGAASLIAMRDLWKTYEMGSEQVHALHGVSFDVRKGEYIAITGPSGSGQVHFDELDRLPGYALERRVLAQRKERLRNG